MLALLAQSLAIAACVVIVWRAEPVLNRMSPCTPWVVRIAFWLIAIAAIGAIVCMLMGDVPPWPSVIGACGTAALLFCDRRLRYLTRHRKGGRHESF